MLHGEIKINGRTIGYWEAKRQEPFRSDEVPTMYRYEIHVGISVWRGHISHTPDHGSAVLMGKIFSATLVDSR